MDDVTADHVVNAPTSVGLPGRRVHVLNGLAGADGRLFNRLRLQEWRESGAECMSETAAAL